MLLTELASMLWSSIAKSDPQGEETMRRKPIKELHTDAIEVLPRDYDWSEGYTERWDYDQAERCEECRVPLVTSGEAHHHEIDDESDCDGYVCAEGPMMNYFYELPRFAQDWEPGEAAKRIVDLPLCIVHLIDEEIYGLALTGGGMDLSWEICEAHMLLGYLPPLHFCDLPEMAGLKLNARTRWILAGCGRSASVAVFRAGMTRDKLRRLRQRIDGANEPVRP